MNISEYQDSIAIVYLLSFEKLLSDNNQNANIHAKHTCKNNFGDKNQTKKAVQSLSQNHIPL